ncbi:Autophagy-related protein 2 [Pleurostoma richardsiae]|uniref:Autophagy-related protein 2 n=1 Tax=Pleurostoma richardsiae TaxID=41990 RepID=A0AA38S594_9PEZI|nr:Autophagy-related protein 2 [Pleurostoma richardsiae]
MAAFFQSFRSSSMPKRLLRYALSRLELLDADALDMENLDFALGRNTVFEFRDVGIKLQKLEKLLNLPSAFTLQRAKVLNLRVTIPMDFYTSPITVEVDGVDVRLKVSSKDESKHARPRRKGKVQEDVDAVPTAADLAQSFLETQPQREKKELEDALAAETQDLGASVALSEDSNDEDLAYGTGQGLSLPAFLADFLQGIVDRTQVRIRSVTFQLDVEVPVEASSASPDLVTLQLALEGISVEGVTVQEQEEDGTPRIVPKEGKRHISLDNIRAYLISEANVFSTLARSPSMPSSAASQSPVVTERSSPFGDEPFVAQSPYEDSMTDSGGLSRSQYPLQDSEDAFNIPYELDDPFDGNEDDHPLSTLSTPRASVYQDFLHEGVHAQSAVIEAEQPPWSSFHREARSEPSLQHDDLIGPDVAAPSHPPTGSGPSSSASDGSREAPPEDLTLSHVYSHEEAESMYMSAFSEAEPERTRSIMPGTWDESSTSSPEISPKAKRIATPPLVVQQENAPPEPEKSPAHSEHSSDPKVSPANEDEVQGPPQDNPGSPEPKQAPKGSSSPVAPDESATPRGPTRLVKEIASLKSISIYVPSNHKHIQVASLDSAQSHTAGLSKSISPNLPGAFSVYSSTSTSPPRPLAFQTPTEQEVDRSLEVILAPLEVRFDASIGFLLAMVVSKLLEAVKTGSTSTAAQDKDAATTSKSSSSLPDVKFTAERISILFLEKLSGVADTPERIFTSQAINGEPDILLQASLESLKTTIEQVGSRTETSVNLEKFRFGYANSDILSFDRRLQMRASVRDSFPSAGADVSVKLSRTSDITKCEITTLPLRVHVDLQRLDETFSWFGGLSSFLQMSSSMTSNASQAVKSPAPPAPKPRGVRFDAPIKPDDRSATSDNKLDMRVGGLQLDLVGKECGVALSTSAVKLVSREEGVGIGISRIHLSGPYQRKYHGEVPINVEIANTRLEYLMTPKDNDLDRLLALITPSKAKFDDNDDEIMVDTLLRQRRKGPVLRLNFDKVSARLVKLHQLSCLPALGEEIARLGTVAKYLPEDDRPGLLTLGLVRAVDLSVDVGGRFGVVNAALGDLEIGHITIPSLVAFGVGSITVNRNKIEELLGSSHVSRTGLLAQTPVLMVRVIGDEMEPVIKVRMRNLNIEYRVPTIMDLLDLGEDATPQDFEASLAASVANLGEQAHAAITGKEEKPKVKSNTTKPTVVDLAFNECLIGLNPLGITSKLVIVLTDARLEVALPKDDNVNAVGHLKKASVLLIDDISLAEAHQGTEQPRQRPSFVSQRPADMVSNLCAKGFVDICQISSAQATIQVTTTSEGEKHIDVELRDDLLVMETCADSTQTLIALANALKPPTPPSKEVKYKTEVIPVQDLLASISADAFGKAEGDYDFDKDFALAQEIDEDEDPFEADDSNPSPLNVDSQYYQEEPEVAENLFDATSSSIISNRTTTQDTKDGVLLTHFSTEAIVDDGSDLDVQENYFGTGSVLEGTAHRWNSAQNTYDRKNDPKVHRSPLKVCVRDVHIIWNLFDGYDWQHTREVITKTVQEVETKAYERRTRGDRRPAFEQDLEEEEAVIGDFLFNSIYIGIPANHDPRELTQAINQQLDKRSETESIATTTVTATTSRAGGSHRSRAKKLRLNRSRHHKITFELKGVNVDVVTFPPGSGETESSIDVRIRDLDIFDHVPTSTWKKFATYDQDAGEREMGTSMVHLELLNVKPVPELAASEIVLKATVLPLRLHVDQDALDFITRFFEFKDDSTPVHGSPSDVPFIQRAEVNAVPVKLDFKPKRVDYAGLRSGHTTEFMNFLILDSATMVLRHTIIYGVSGFDRLGKTLNDIWMPDVKRTQLPGVLAGLAPVRSLVNVGSGFKDLIEVPMREYKRDGRIVRSIGKGAAAFARTTGTEIVKLGAKMAIGTQYVLQGAEGMLVKNPQDQGGGGTSISSGWEEEDPEQPEERKQISLYADQPTGVVQGLRHAYASLSRDLSTARDAVIAVPAEVMESQSAQGAAKAVLRRAPTIIFRPAIGATRAIGQTLMGATNALDPKNIRRAEDKYKSGPGR